MPMIWYVAIGSAAGGAARYALGTVIQRAAHTSFPVGTLAINVTGSLLLGFLVEYAVRMPALSPELRVLLTIGFCGGYTTFSTFSLESARLIQTGELSRAAGYMAASVLVSLAAVFAGIGAARSLAPR